MKMAPSTDTAKVYRKAALILERGACRDAIPGACTVLADAAYPGKGNREGYGLIAHTPLVMNFTATFKPEGAGGYWGRLWSDASEHDAQANDCRILALCFMAAMVEAGDAILASIIISAEALEDYVREFEDSHHDIGSR